MNRNKGMPFFSRAPCVYTMPKVDRDTQAIDVSTRKPQKERDFYKIRCFDKTEDESTCKQAPVALSGCGTGRYNAPRHHAPRKVYGWLAKFVENHVGWYFPGVSSSDSLSRG